MPTLEERRKQLRDRLNARTAPPTPIGLRQPVPAAGDVRRMISDIDRPELLPGAEAPQHGGKTANTEFTRPEVVPEFNEQTAPQYATPRPVEETPSAQPLEQRQTSFTNADAAKYETPARRSLSDIPGRDFYGKATFTERLRRFREDNPEFTPRSQRAGKGFTSNAGGAFDREQAARRARFAVSDQLDAADRLDRPGRGGSIRGRTEAAKIRNEAAKTIAGSQARNLRTPAAAGGGSSYSQDLTKRRLAEEKLAGSQAEDRFSNLLALRKQILGGQDSVKKRDLEERRFGLQAASEIRNTRQSTLDDVFGPQTADNDNRQRAEAAQFLDRSNIESPQDVGTAIQMYKVAKPLMEAEGISTAVAPFLARMFDWAKGNATPLTNEADVQAAIKRFSSGQGPGGVQLDPGDVSARNRQIMRGLRDR